MVKQRNIGVAIILCIITCGIYYLYWIYALTNEVSHLNDDPSFNGGTTLLLGIITCGIYFLFWYYQLGEHIMELRAKKNLPAQNESILLVVLAIFSFGLIAIAIAQSNVNRVI